MVKSEAVDAARNFLEIVWSEGPPSDASLVAALDRLLAAYHETPAMAPNHSELEPPRQAWKATWDDAAERFPSYGFYAVADPLDLDATSSSGVGDAIDDIADISKEMRDMVWFADNVGVDYAHMFFREFYFHWGQHARDLTRYIFALQNK